MKNDIDPLAIFIVTLGIIIVILLMTIIFLLYQGLQADYLDDGQILIGMNKEDAKVLLAMNSEVIRWTMKAIK